MAPGCRRTSAFATSCSQILWLWFSYIRLRSLFLHLAMISPVGGTCNDFDGADLFEPGTVYNSSIPEKSASRSPDFRAGLWVAGPCTGHSDTELHAGQGVSVFRAAPSNSTVAPSMKNAVRLTSSFAG